MSSSPENPFNMIPDPFAGDHSSVSKILSFLSLPLVGSPSVWMIPDKPEWQDYSHQYTSI